MKCVWLTDTLTKFLLQILVWFYKKKVNYSTVEYYVIFKKMFLQVMALTNEGKFESKSAKKRTPKNECE